ASPMTRNPGPRLAEDAGTAKAKGSVMVTASRRTWRSVHRRAVGRVVSRMRQVGWPFDRPRFGARAEAGRTSLAATEDHAAAGPALVVLEADEVDEERGEDQQRAHRLQLGQGLVL